MKLFKIALIAALLVFCTCPDEETLQASEEHEGSDGLVKTEKDKKDQSKISALFNMDESQSSECKQKRLEQDGNSDSSEYTKNTPIPKENPWKNYGKGDIAFFFDHMDYLFQKKLAAKFQKIYDTAKAITFENQFDIYSEDVLKLKIVQGRDFSQGFTPYIRNFNPDAYEKALRFPQVVKMIQTAGWFYESHDGFNKISFDKFDFNGDGRLDMFEFILFSIIHNIPDYGKGSCVQDTCYDDILSELVDPIFSFADCEKASKVSAEQLWNGLKKLKRPSTEKYSLFTCNIKLDFQKEYRTISVSDFILQGSMGQEDGLIDLKEFRTNLLLGYWKRQVSAFDIDTGDKYNKKAARWNADGTEDLMCGKIKNFLPESWKNKDKNKKLSPSATPLPGAKKEKHSTSFLQES